MVTNRGLAVVLVRVLALVLVLYGAAGLAWLYGVDHEYWPVPAARALLPMLVGALLWVSVGRVVDRMLPQRTAAGSEESALSAADAERIGYAVLGLYLAATAVPELSRVAVEIQRWREVSALSGLPSSLQMNLLTSGIRFVLGVALFFGARGLVGLVAKLRRAGA